MADQSFLDLRKQALAIPDKVAVVCDGASLSYENLEALANRFASVLRERGLQRGDHVATLMGNRPEMLAVAWAAWRSGVYLTPMPTALAAAELGYLVGDCDAKLVLADSMLPHVAEPLPPMFPGRPIHWLSLGGSLAGYTPVEPLLATATLLPPDQEMPGALMMYTSGTTGAPKGVYRPLLPPDWRGTPPFAADLIQLFDLGGETVRYLSTAPLYHAAPLRFALAVTAAGGTVHVMGRFDAEEALGQLEKLAITHSQWVPAMFQRLLTLPSGRREAFSAPAHQYAIHGAAPCHPELKQAMIDWWGPVFLEYYSGSEGVGLTLIDSAEALAHRGSVGRARKGIIHVIDETGAEVPAGETGRIYFSGGPPFEYYKAAGKTAARTLESGWQTFGDIGHVDDSGYLYLTDRADDMIISGGVNIYPQEIEAVIRGVAAVWDCAVVGVRDERFGEKPVAFIVADITRASGTSELSAAVRRACQERLGRFKQPAAIHVIDQLPRSPAGKLLRKQLRELIQPVN
ncbi:MAG: AMP-dependent synthetase and ligase [Ramlibacter sp.]|nr:AMP-dependent synthetase and ligase [Ramlibacter sp.]